MDTVEDHLFDFAERSNEPAMCCGQYEDQMTIQEAISLIEGGQPFSSKPLLWADLGCGSGLFSRALASLLPDGSKIVCLDKDLQHLDRNTIRGVQLEFVLADFVKYDFGATKYNGFILANSLHFVQDKKALLGNLTGRLNPEGRLVVIEYDSDTGNEWVPYPVPYENLVRLGQSVGFNYVRKLGERHSIYGLGKLYASELSMVRP